MCPDCPRSVIGEPCNSCRNYFYGKLKKPKAPTQRHPPTKRPAPNEVIAEDMPGLRVHYLAEILAIPYDGDYDPMSESTDLTVIGADMQLPAEFQRAIESAGFIPGIQLLQPLSDVVQNPPKDAVGEPKPGIFWYGSNLALGPSFEIIPLAAMTHALLVVDKKMKAESFNHQDDTFKDIVVQESKKKSLPEGVVPRWGVDILGYLPAIQKYGVYFLYATARGASTQFTKNGGKVLTVKAKIAKNAKGNSWWTPDIYVMGAVPETMEQPDHSGIIQKFKSRTPRDPKKEAAEKAAAPGAGKDR